MKKIIAFLLVICTLSTSILASAADYTSVINPPENVTAKGIYMLELGADIENTSDNIVLYSKGANDRLFPASLTKIMTAVVVLKNVQPENLVSKTATMTSELAAQLKKEGSSVAGFMPGEEITLKDLFYGMMLPSGGDATIMLATEIFGGDLNKFIEEMNVTAKELGLTNTNFVNPTGIHDENQYSTPRDMAILTEYAMYKMPNANFFRAVVNTKEYTIKSNKRPSGFVLKTTNLLLTTIPVTNVNGVKTGTTKQAGECLVSSYDDNSVNIITVVMGAVPGKTAGRQAFYDTKTLLNYAKANFKIIRDFKKVPPFTTDVALASNDEGGKVFKFSPATDAEIRLFIPKDFESKITFLPEKDLHLIAPIKSKKEITTAKIMIGDNQIGTTTLVNSKDINIGFKYIFIGIGIIIAIIILIVILIVVLSDNKGKRKRKKRPTARKN
ncbi:MAG: D-alanyl-D-alanine carboxypeptidase family protein [Clostridia bacterium]